MTCDFVRVGGPNAGDGEKMEREAMVIGVAGNTGSDICRGPAMNGLSWRTETARRGPSTPRSVCARGCPLYIAAGSTSVVSDVLPLLFGDCCAGLGVLRRPISLEAGLHVSRRHSSTK